MCHQIELHFMNKTSLRLRDHTCLTTRRVCNMDISVLPNNNHPEKFLQLDVGILPVTHGMFQIGAVMSRQRQWHNRVYSQGQEKNPEKKLSTEGSDVFRDGDLEKHITPQTLKPNIKHNPLYAHISIVDNTEERNKSKPSWTILEYDTHTAHGHLGDYMKDDPRDLNYWMEDLYTPGYDSLLKKKEAEQKRKKIYRILFSVLLMLCVVVIIITVPLVLTRPKD